MTRWIENVSWDAVKNGWHSDMGVNCMLIQIADPATFFPKPAKTFREIYQFEFLDAEDNDPWDDEFKISDEAILQLIRCYTFEAGVRNLNREIAKLQGKEE